MINVISESARGALLILLYALNTAFWVPQILIVAILKLILPWRSWQHFCGRVSVGIANNWVGFNNFSTRMIHRIEWDVEGIEALNPNDWYLILANHQSWTDILVLQKIFYRKIPFQKFFLKKELLWVPLLGLAWWALDFPFMKRYSPSKLKKNPHLKGKDVEITRKACEKFKTIPITIMNFVEGTRFTPEKRRRKSSPYAHLLPPKAGGIAFVLSSMGEHLHRILDVTIVYPQKTKSFWAYMCGRVEKIHVRVRSMPVSSEMVGDYVQDRAFRKQFQAWLNSLWLEKDHTIQALQQP